MNNHDKTVKLATIDIY